MKKYLPFLPLFFLSLLVSFRSFAQGNGGGNNGGNKYEIVGNQQPCVGAIEVYTITPNPGNNAVVWDWDGPRAQTNEVAWELISVSADKSKATFKVGDKPGTIRAKPVPGSNNTENLPVHPGRSLQVAIDGPAAVCANTDLVYKLVVNNLGNGKKGGKNIDVSDLGISWNVTGLTVISGQNTGTLTVRSAAGFTSGSVSVTVNVPGQSGGPGNNGKGVGPITGFCGGNAAASLQIGLGANCTPPCPVTTVTIAGPTSVCPTPTDYELDDLPVYTAEVTNGTADMTYGWVVPTGWQIVSGVSSNTIRVRVGSTPGSVQVSVNNNCATAPATANRAITFSNNCPNPTSECPATTVTIDGPAIVCPSQPEAITFTATVTNGTSGTTYDWDVPSGWLIRAGQGTNAIEVLVGNTAGQVSLTIGNNCGNTASDVQAVTFNTDCGTTPPNCFVPQINITGPATVCPAQSEAITFSAGVRHATAGMTYEWSVPNGWLLQSGQGTNTIQVLVGNTPGQVSLTVTNNCGETGTDAHAVSFRTNCDTTPPACPAPQVAVIGPTEVCAFGEMPEVFTANVTNGSNNQEFVWTVPSDWFIIAGENTNTIEVLVGFESGPVSVSVTNNNCGKSASHSLTVTALEDCSSLEPLPVELISFVGESAKSGVLLEWSTATEKNNDYFELQRSPDGKQFAKVGQVKGKGTTNSRQVYTMRDNHVGIGVHYYRLKQVDLDGKFEYSKVIAVNHNYGLALTNLVVAPNPVAQGQFTVQLPTTTGGQVQIIDMNGRLISTQKLGAGISEATFSTQALNLRTGVYVVQFKDGENISHTKIVVR